MIATVTAEDVMAALRARYAAPQYALLPQVRDATGGYATRTADAIALGLWQSRGIHLHGFEVKVYRGDWRSELKNPEKAEAVGRYCHYWWVAAPAGVVDRTELPDTWGLLALHGRQLRVDHPATYRPDVRPLDMPFLAAILRKAQNASASEAELRAEHQRGYRDGSADEKKAAEQRYEYASKELTRLREVMASFEAASGVHIDQFDPAPVADALRRVLAGETGRGPAQRIQQARQAAILLLDATHDWASPNDIPYRAPNRPAPVSDALAPLLGAPTDGR